MATFKNPKLLSEVILLDEMALRKKYNRCGEDELDGWKIVNTYFSEGKPIFIDTKQRTTRPPSM